jgi:branched-chain amino acid transport system substrate-binding protein
MRGIFVGTAVLSLLLPFGAQVSASAKAPTPGSTCKTSGQTIDTGAVLFTCVKSGTKLIWNKGVRYTTSPFKVGMIYCKTGPLAGLGDAYLEGWKSGLKWVSGGKANAQGIPVVNGRPIQLIDIADDKSNNVTAASAAFEDQVRRGAKVILGTCSSEVALALAGLAEQRGALYFPGSATDDGLSGVNRWTFRTGVQIGQELDSVLSLIPLRATVTIITEQETEAVTARQAAANRGLILTEASAIPVASADLGSFVERVAQGRPSHLIVLSDRESIWREVRMQRLLRDSDVVTILGLSSSWKSIGLLGGENFLFSSHYFAGASRTKEEAALLRDLAAAGKRAEPSSADGFNAALMVARAAKADLSGLDAREKIWKALEGFRFDSVKGQMTVRTQDHALLQPMFQARLALRRGEYLPYVLNRMDLVMPTLRASGWGARP